MPMNWKPLLVGIGLYCAAHVIVDLRLIHELLSPPPLGEIEPLLIPQFPAQTVQPRVSERPTTIDYPKPFSKAYPVLPDADLKLAARNILVDDYTLTLKSSGPHRWTSETEHGLTFDVVQHPSHVELRVRY
jgi:hypothetical protein